MPLEINRLYESLRTGIVHVVFTKRDNDVRNMLCTLEPSTLPPPSPNNAVPEKQRRVNENVIAVYDIQKRGWRSFRIDSIISWHAHGDDDDNAS